MFDYGVSDTYGNSVPAAINIPIPVPMGTNLTSSMIPVMADIIGLLPNTTYHFRVRVDTSQGTKYGDDFVFTTTN